jgi:hypothetical protein
VVSNQIYHRHLQPTECTVHSIHNTMIRHCSQDVLMCLTLIDGKEPALLLVTSVQWIRFQMQPRSVSLGSFKQSFEWALSSVLCTWKDYHVDRRQQVLMSYRVQQCFVMSGSFHLAHACRRTNDPHLQGAVSWYRCRKMGDELRGGYEDVLLESLLLETNSRKDVTCRYHNSSFCDLMQASSCKGDARMLLTISQNAYHKQT